MIAKQKKKVNRVVGKLPTKERERDQWYNKSFSTIGRIILHFKMSYTSYFGMKLMMNKQFFSPFFIKKELQTTTNQKK